VIQECYFIVYFVISPVQLDIKILKERLYGTFFLPKFLTLVKSRATTL
jgi:hypothetical protein